MAASVIIERSLARRAADPTPSTLGHGWLDGHAWNRRDVLVAVLVGLFAVAFVFIFRTSIVPTDPWNYVQAARGFPADTWVPLGYTRYGMILPLIPLVSLFGDTEITYYFWPLVGSGMVAACLYLLGVRFWGKIAAVLAIVLALSSPIVFSNLSRGYPDVQSTGVFLLAIVLCFRARDQRHSRGTAPAAPLLLAGFLLGWAFEARETTAVTWPIIAVILWTRGRELRRAFVLVVAAMAMWAVADLAIGQFGYGDALMRVHAFTRQDLAATQLPGDIAVQGELVGRDRWFYLTAVPGYLSATADGISSIVVGLVGLAGFAFRRARFAALLLALAYFGFVGIAGGFVPDHPSGRIDIQRYWIPFLIFAGLAAAGTVHQAAILLTEKLRSYDIGGFRLARPGTELALALLLALAPIITLAINVAGNSALAINGATQLSQLRSHLGAQGVGSITVWTDWESKRLLPIYQRTPFGTQQVWSGPINSINVKSKLQRGDYVVINSPTDDSCYFCRLIISAYLTDLGGIPGSWTEVWATEERNLILYRVS